MNVSEEGFVHISESMSDFCLYFCSKVPILFCYCKNYTGISICFIIDVTHLALKIDIQI